MDEALERRWKSIEQLRLICPVCGDDTWKRWGTFVGMETDPVEERPDYGSMNTLARSCAGCGYVILFRRFLDT